MNISKMWNDKIKSEISEALRHNDLYQLYNIIINNDLNINFGINTLEVNDNSGVRNDYNLNYYLNWKELIENAFSFFKKYEDSLIKINKPPQISEQIVKSNTINSFISLQ